MHIYARSHTVTMITVLMGTGISALSSLMDPVSQALTIIVGFAMQVGPAISKAVSPAVSACSMAFGPMLKKLYPDRIIRIFGGGSNGEQGQAAAMLARRAQGLVKAELEVYLHTVHTLYIACLCGFIALRWCPRGP